MADTVIDSSIIIDFLRGREPAANYLAILRSRGPLTTHAVVVAEVLIGVRNRAEQHVVEDLFDRFRILHITEADSARSIDFLRANRLSNGVGWPDCLIAATCARLGAQIATLNEKHFSTFSDLRVLRPY